MIYGWIYIHSIAITDNDEEEPHLVTDVIWFAYANTKIFEGYQLKMFAAGPKSGNI